MALAQYKVVKGTHPCRDYIDAGFACSCGAAACRSCKRKFEEEIIYGKEDRDGFSGTGWLCRECAIKLGYLW